MLSLNIYWCLFFVCLGICQVSWHHHDISPLNISMYNSLRIQTSQVTILSLLRQVTEIWLSFLASFLKNQRGRITYCRWILPSWETTRDTGKNIWNICLKTMERYQGAEVKKAKILKRKQAHRSEYNVAFPSKHFLICKLLPRSWEAEQNLLQLHGVGMLKT